MHEGARNQHEIDVAFAEASGPEVEDQGMMPVVGMQPLVDLSSRDVEIP
jgi:hypothetical protein